MSESSLASTNDAVATDAEPSLDTDAQTKLNKLYHVTLREIEDDTTLVEIDSELYKDTSAFIGNLSRQEYSGIESNVKKQIVVIAIELISLLFETRLAKAAKLKAVSDNANKRDHVTIITQRLLDEEKFVLDSEEERDERRDIVLSATKSGRFKLLESISEKHKTSRVVIRFLKNVESMIGVDMEMYGPFKAEDITTIPHENAQALISENVAVRVRWEDYGGRL